MPDQTPNWARWAWIAAIVIVGGILFLAWDRFGPGGHSAADGGQGLVDQITGNASQWTLAEEVDPMTDEQLLSASRRFETDGFVIDTTIACRPSSGTVTYSFTTFGPDGDTPADHRQRLTSSGNRIIAVHDVEFRVDTGKATAVPYFDLRGDNYDGRLSGNYDGR